MGLGINQFVDRKSTFWMEAVTLYAWEGLFSCFLGRGWDWDWMGVNQFVDRKSVFWMETVTLAYMHASVSFLSFWERGGLGLVMGGC